MPARQFYLPPRAKGTDRSTEESLRAIEDYLQSVREVFDGKLTNGAVIGGTILDSNGMPVAAGGMQSGNYIGGSAGWRVSDSGSAEFQGGTFRGTVLGKSPSMTRGINATAFDVAAGQYVVAFPRLEVETGDTGILEYTAPTITTRRSGLYLVLAGFEVNMDAIGNLGCYIMGQQPGAVSATSGLRQAGNTLRGSGPFLISATAVLRQNANDQAFVVLESTAQFDLIRTRSTFLSKIYLSDL